jgi:hypothetical protein
MAHNLGSVSHRSLGWPTLTSLALLLSIIGSVSLLGTGCGGDTDSSTTSSGGANSAGTGGSTQVWLVATGGASTAGGSAAVDSTCQLAPNVDDGFADQALGASSSWPAAFYTWTTAEQVAALRAGGDLFSRSEREGLGRGTAIEELTRYSQAGHGSAGEKLAGVLVNSVFAKARFAWTNAWATRMGWPGESYGDQLLKIELREDAWVVSFDGGYLSVHDLNNESIATDVALATPERIGAIYFVRGGLSTGGPMCGTFLGQSSNGYREFVLGNLAMVRRWSLATAGLIETLNTDIQRFEKLRGLVAACPPRPYFETWNAEVVCSWGYSVVPAPTSYINALALPSQYYYPDAATLQNVIDTLRASIPQFDPLEVDLGQ